MREFVMNTGVYIKAVFVMAFMVLMVLPVYSTAAEKGEKMEDLTAVRVVIETSLGEIELKFFHEEAPNHVKNFIK